MKFATSLIFTTISFNLWAFPLKLYYERDPKWALGIKQALIDEHKIPEDLIEITEAKNCEDLVGKGKFELCLKDNGDLETVSVDRIFINETLSIFKAP